MLYEIKMMRWNKNDAYINKSRSDGAPFNFINVAAAPALTAELQLELAAYELEKNDMRGAEQRMASAMFGLLLTDPNHVHSIGKVIVQMIDRLVAAQDVVARQTSQQFRTNSSNGSLHQQRVASQSSIDGGAGARLHERPRGDGKGLHGCHP